jgi:hypothetical protein
MFKTLYQFSGIPKWSTINPYNLSGSNPHIVKNILDGKVVSYNKTIPIMDPMKGD